MDPECVRVGQDTFSQYDTPASEKGGVASPSSGKGKSSATKQPSPHSGDDDDEAQVNSDLLSAWTQRLQVLTVVTTFLASMDGELFSLTTINAQIGQSVSKTSREIVYACLAGALIFHICASIIGYVASFALIRYRIVDAAADDDTKVRGVLFFGLSAAQPAQRLSRRIVLEAVSPLRWLMCLLQRPETLGATSVRFSSLPPLALVSRCYHTTLCLTAAGFILAVIGILMYTWAALQTSVGIFSTVCVGVGIGAGVWAIAI